MKILVPAVLALTISGFLRTPAYSHRPRLIEGNTSHAAAYRVQDPETSWALYGDLESFGRVEYFTFTVKGSAMRIQPELIVPDEPLFDGFEPTFVIYGTALTGPAPAKVNLPAGRGVVGATPAHEDEFEGFTRKSFRKVATLDATLAPGEYGVAVFSPGGKTGEYVFVIGTKEEFSDDDLGPMVTGCGRIFY